MKRVRTLAITRAVSVLMLGAASCSASAFVTPPACDTDAHVRCATYDPNAVYRIPFRIGQATVIQFEPGEVVEGPESGLGTGDAKGWTIGAKGNWFMLKAQERNPDTNLLVVTNRRRYVFGLETAGKADTPTWALSFDYPDTRAKAAREAKEKADRVKAMSNADGDLADRRNEDFDMKGICRSLRPLSGTMAASRTSSTTRLARRRRSSASRPTARRRRRIGTSRATRSLLNTLHRASCCGWGRRCWQSETTATTLTGHSIGRALRRRGGSG